MPSSVKPPLTIKSLSKLLDKKLKGRILPNDIARVSKRNKTMPVTNGKRIIQYIGGGHQIDWHDKMKKGFAKHGIQTVVGNSASPTPSDVAVIWGWRMHRVIELQKRYKGQVLVMERGYFNDRFEYTSVGWDGLNRNAKFYNENSPSDRWEKHGVPILPWKEGGNRIVIAGQVQGDMSCDGIDLHIWYNKLVENLRKILKEKSLEYEIVFKPHPNARKNSAPKKVPIVHDIKGARCIIAYSSNMIAESIINGYPGIVFSKGSMAWNLAQHDITEIDNLLKPERKQWLYDLAYTQWTREEMVNGECWEHIKVGLK